MAAASRFLVPSVMDDMMEEFANTHLREYNSNWPMSLREFPTGPRLTAPPIWLFRRD